MRKCLLGVVSTLALSVSFGSHAEFVSQDNTVVDTEANLVWLKFSETNDTAESFDEVMAKSPHGA
jgi:hypothetical protein